VPLAVTRNGAKRVSHLLKVDVEPSYLGASRQKTGIGTGVAHVSVLPVEQTVSRWCISASTGTGSAVNQVTESTPAYYLPLKQVIVWQWWALPLLVAYHFV
jgi:hypothetical protein